MDDRRISSCSEFFERLTGIICVLVCLGLAICPIILACIWLPIKHEHAAFHSTLGLWAFCWVLKFPVIMLLNPNGRFPGHGLDGCIYLVLFILGLLLVGIIISSILLVTTPTHDDVWMVVCANTIMDAAMIVLIGCFFFWESLRTCGNRCTRGWNYVCSRLCYCVCCSNAINGVTVITENDTSEC